MRRKVLIIFLFFVAACADKGMPLNQPSNEEIFGMQTHLTIKDILEMPGEAAGNVNNRAGVGQCVGPYVYSLYKSCKRMEFGKKIIRKTLKHNPLKLINFKVKGTSLSELKRLCTVKAKNIIQKYAQEKALFVTIDEVRVEKTVLGNYKCIADYSYPQAQEGRGEFCGGVDPDNTEIVTKLGVSLKDVKKIQGVKDIHCLTCDDIIVKKDLDLMKNLAAKLKCLSTNLFLVENNEIKFPTQDKNTSDVVRDEILEVLRILSVGYPILNENPKTKELFEYIQHSYPDR